MIHEEIVTCEVAKLAKEKGFPQDPKEYNNCQLYCWDNLRKIHSLCISAMWYTGEYNREDMYAAPTQSLLQRWLREEKGVNMQVIWIEPYNRYYWSLWINDEFRMSEYLDLEQAYSNYELALEDALKYALENLV